MTNPEDFFEHLFDKRPPLRFISRIYKEESIPVGCKPPACQPYGGRGSLYGGDVQCIMGNYHIGSPSVNRQTHTTENITFPQLRWRAVTRESKCVSDNLDGWWFKIWLVRPRLLRSLHNHVLLISAKSSKSPKVNWCTKKSEVKYPSLAKLVQSGGH